MVLIMDQAVVCTPKVQFHAADRLRKPCAFSYVHGFLNLSAVGAISEKSHYRYMQIPEGRNALNIVQVRKMTSFPFVIVKEFPFF